VDIKKLNEWLLEHRVKPCTVAKHLGLCRSTISKWRARGHVSKGEVSYIEAIVKLSKKEWIELLGL